MNEGLTCPYCKRFVTRSEDSIDLALDEFNGKIDCLYCHKLFDPEAPPSQQRESTALTEGVQGVEIIYDGDRRPT